MATPRKRFFTVECSLYREPWPRDLKLALVMLGMHMTDRWAADSLTPKQATVAHLSVGDLLTITGAETRDEAHKVLHQLASLVSLRVMPLENGFTRVEWRKLAETQWSKSRFAGSKQGKHRATLSPKNAPSDSDSDPDSDPDSEEAEAEEEKKKNPEAAAKPAARQRPRVVKSLAPDDLDSEQKTALRTWVREKHPALEPRLREMVDACLDHHQGRGNAMVDWVATCRSWIRNDIRFGGGRPAHSPAAKQDERAQLLIDNAKAAAQLTREREANEQRKRAIGDPDSNVRRLRAGSESVSD